jgi:peroxiredoxin
LYTRIFAMRALTIATLILAAGSLWAAQLPRQSPDFSIQLTNGKQIKVSDYRGKVLCLTFILTTCPHCQKTTQLWDSIYPELAPKGLEVVEAALNDNPNIPQFVSQFKVPFPVGTAGVLPALDYIQWPKDKRPLVPFLVFIDRNGVIRAQYTGVDEAFFDNQQEQHMRDEAEKLLNEGAGKAKPAHKSGS